MNKNKISRKNLYLFISLQIILMGLMFSAGLLTEKIIYQRQSTYPIFTQAYQLLKDNALKPLPAPKILEYGMIRGLLEAFNDPFTVFVEPPQNELQTNQLQGKFGGIGVRLDRDTENFYIVFPLPDSPAAKAGLLDGDRLVQIDNLPITADTSQDVVDAAIQGKVNSTVKIEISRPPDFSQHLYSVSRQEYPIPSVVWNLVPGALQTGIVQVSLIADTTPSEIQKAFDDLKKQGASSFILDLRNNGGGLVQAGVDSARLFLKKGIVIPQQYRDQSVESFTVNKTGIYSDVPIVVLINHGTASAAEIVAGALQGQKRSLLIGFPSYGKDTIQLVFDLQDGSSLHVTSAHWWVPGLFTSLGGKGLQPDIPLPEDQANGSEAVQAAVKELQKIQP
jgi:carboxyl-terminal processing protease